jgi:hypothetical protein
LPEPTPNPTPQDLHPQAEPATAPISLPQKETLMLDVHPAHHAASTWREFFIHIATIVIGLLIAVSLEQTVEYFHHRHQVAETREALAHERELNRQIIADNVIKLRREIAALQNNLLVLDALQRHPGISRSALPGILTWHSDLQTPLLHAAWSTAQQTNVLDLLPAEEVRRSSHLYDFLDRLTTLANDEYAELCDVRAYNAVEPDPTRWSPAQVAQALDRTRVVAARLYNYGDLLGYLHIDFPDFASVADREIYDLIRYKESEDAPGTEAARNATVQRIDAAGKFNDYLPQARTDEGNPRIRNVTPEQK